jgi:rare lipoprotein A (peptidoglycan hydrolase)
MSWKAFERIGNPEKGVIPVRFRQVRAAGGEVVDSREWANELGPCSAPRRWGGATFAAAPETQRHRQVPCPTGPKAASAGARPARLLAAAAAALSLLAATAALL